MVLVNEGNLAGAATEFETYVKLAPDGPNVNRARRWLAAGAELLASGER